MQFPVSGEKEWIVEPGPVRTGQAVGPDECVPMVFVQSLGDAMDLDGLFGRDSAQLAVAGREDGSADLALYWGDSSL